MWSIPKPLQKWGDKPQHREENWIELFFDILFVPMAMSLGRAMSVVSRKSSIDPGELSCALFTCSLLFGTIHRTWITFTIYLNKFDQRDVLNHLAHAGLMITTAMLGAYSLPNEDYKAWNPLQHTEEFVYSFVVNQSIILLLYLYVSYYLRDFRAHFGIQALNQLFLVCCYLLSLLWMRTVWMFLIWAVALFLHSWVSFIWRVATVPVSIPHLTTRCGCFVMVMLGESVIQILQANENRNITWYKTSLILALLIVFNLALQYFHTQPKDPSQHALNRSRVVGLLWFNCHSVLGFFILVTGVGLEMVFMDSLKIDVMDIFFLSAGVGFSLLCLGGIRFSHKGKAGRSQRKCAYVFRFFIASLLVFLPIFIGNQWQMDQGVELLAIVSALTTVSTSLDYFRRPKSHGATHLVKEGPGSAGEFGHDEEDNSSDSSLEPFIPEHPSPSSRFCEM